GMAIDDAILIPPIAAEKIAENAALIDGGAVRIVQPIERGDAGQRWRFPNRHPPLQHAEIRLADAADFAIRPGLMTQPFDDVVEANFHFTRYELRLRHAFLLPDLMPRA